ncbi:opioid growth factor receptor-like [Scomber japonicus]|uniref:opioid growth factor receptor-like n=1 Tax=Scomber japonicus TaxID=13676 RepID=UPI0023058E4B|nr:opioid growth factor receptor-like [Scomber japonicus]
MRSVSLLCYLIRNVVTTMAWCYHRACSLLGWLRSRMVFIFRSIGNYAPILGFALLALRFSGGRRGKDEPETSAENKPLETSSPEKLQEVYCEDLPQATAGSIEVSHQESESKEHEDEEEEYRVKTTDEFYCDYDSTWETEESQEGSSKRINRPAQSRHYKFNRFRDAARDMQNYRHDYPNTGQSRRKSTPGNGMPNLEFYLGQRASSPDGALISDFHDHWKEDYDTLEFVHTYIQWLFPLEEPGLNYDAKTLTKAEVMEFRQNPIAKENLLKSYKLMLDFYGIELCDENTGKVRRSANWRDRFQNLNSHTHNNLRITRILKCMGTLGFPHYQAPLVHFFLNETLFHGELPRVKDSALSYFLFAVRDKKQRRELIKFAYLHYDHRDDFVWCPKKIQMKWSKEMHSNKKVDMNPSIGNRKAEDKPHIWSQ